ncbi:MAG: pentapeptide repeat-containing protein [Angelakisella sp.]
MKIKPPELTANPEIIEGMFPLCDPDGDGVYLENLIVRDVTLTDEDICGISCSSIVFERCRLLNCTAEKSTFTDVVFKSCDLSGSSFTGSYWNRCQLQNCKLVGASLAESSLRQLLIENCNLNYVTLDSSGMNDIFISESNLTNASISQCRLKNWKAAGSRFVGASFFRTPLAGIDFSENTIDGIIVSENHSELAGMTVSPVQAVELSKLLQIKIK